MLLSSPIFTKKTNRIPENSIDAQATYQNIRNLLQNGNTLVHCRHGYDRSGVIMGLWMKENGATDQEIIDFNRWKNYLKNKGRYYRKYWNAVFEE